MTRLNHICYPTSLKLFKIQMQMLPVWWPILCEILWYVFTIGTTTALGMRGYGAQEWTCCSPAAEDTLINEA